jgi:two-component system sensor histidine kinase KdpD
MAAPVPPSPGIARRTALAALPLAVRVALVAAVAAVATVIIAILEQAVGVADASPLYLIPVVLAAALLGTWGAVGASIAAFLIYDFAFTTPRFTFEVSDPAEWLNLLLFLFVAVVLGRLTALFRDRADEADRRAREAGALVAISRDIATAGSFEEAAQAVADRLRDDAEMEAVWVTVTTRPGAVVAASGAAAATTETAAVPWTLVGATADGASDWLRVHDGDAGGPDPATTGAQYSVAIGSVVPVGSIHASRVAGDPMPGRGARRLLTLAADQLGVAHRRDELRAEATAAEVARQSDALRGAILDSVSHDLRTPIASIRVLAGGLADPATTPDPSAVRTTATAIDEQAAGLGTLVNGLLDMGRIQAGAVNADLRPYDLRDLVETTLRRVAGDAERRSIAVEISDRLPPAVVDAVLFDAALGNVVENALVHGAGAPVRIRATEAGDGLVLMVEDGGSGVPDDMLPHLFDRFFRGEGATAGARRGLGMGLAIAKGFVEAMGGTIGAGRGELGGLCIAMRLPAATGLHPE